jgi:hypothetical protein
MAVASYNEQFSGTNGAVETAELLLPTATFSLVGTNTVPAVSAAIRISGSRSSSTDQDVFVIRRSDLVLPAGVPITDYSLYVTAFGGAPDVSFYADIYPFGTPPGSFSTRNVRVTGAATSGRSGLFFPLGGSDEYWAIQVPAASLTGPYSLDLSFIYTPVPQAGALLSLATATASQPEGNTGTTSFAFTIQRSGLTSGSTTVAWAVTGAGTSPATAADFVGGVLPGGSVTFLPGDTEKLITVPVAGDGASEPDESFLVSLGPAPAGAQLLVGSLLATITNDDVAPSTLRLVTTTSGREAGPVATVFTATRSGSLAAALAVPYTLGGTATGGSDYTGATSGSFSFAAGAASASLTLATIDDGVHDPGETIVASLTPPAGYVVAPGGSLTATATLLDNELGTLQLVTTTSGREAGPVATVFTATRSGSLAAALAVPYTLSGTATRASDYTAAALTGTLSFAVGANTARITLPTINDTSYDPGETLTATLGLPTGYQLAPGGSLRATATLLDNEPHLITIAQTRDGNEAGPLAAVFTLSKTGPRTAPLTVAYTLAGTATPGLDHTGAVSGTVTFPVGSNTTTLTLVVLDDTVADADELIEARITAPAGYTVVPGFGVADALILDNDPLIGVAVAAAAPVRVPKLVSMPKPVPKLLAAPAPLRRGLAASVPAPGGQDRLSLPFAALRPALIPAPTLAPTLVPTPWLLS